MASSHEQQASADDTINYINPPMPFPLPRVTIQFCTQCKWMLRAAYFAQELLSTFSTGLGEVALQPATGGTFVITIHWTDPGGGDEQQDGREGQQRIQIGSDEARRHGERHGGDGADDRHSGGLFGDHNEANVRGPIGCPVEVVGIHAFGLFEVDDSTCPPPTLVSGRGPVHARVLSEVDGQVSLAATPQGGPAIPQYPNPRVVQVPRGTGAAAADSGGAALVRAVRARVLWDRKRDGGFPETKELKRRVRDVIEPGRDLGHVDRHHSAKKGADRERVDQAVVEASNLLEKQTRGGEEEKNNEGRREETTPGKTWGPENCEDCK